MFQYHSIQTVIWEGLRPSLRFKIMKNNDLVQPPITCTGLEAVKAVLKL